MNQITIVGVGLREGDLTLGAISALRSGAQIVLRTERCACAKWLKSQGILYVSLDLLYEQTEDFDALTDAMCDNIRRMAEHSDVVFAVPDVRDQAACRLASAHPDAVSLIPGVPVDAALYVYAQTPCLCVAASDHDTMMPEANQATLVREIDSRQLASEVKLRLTERYPDQWQIRLKMPDGRVQSVELSELDRQKDGVYGHALAAYVPKADQLTALNRYGFEQLNQIMRRLRGPDGCPWDMKQTHQTLSANMVEEAYEAVDAINQGDMDSLYDELGDVLLQVTLHAEIARQHGEFTIDDVTSAVCAKLISRHRHIFGDAVAATPEEVLKIWEQAKKKEKKLQSVTDAMRAVTTSLPQLMRAQKVQKKADDVGFGWEQALDALEKVYEEADEVKQAIRLGSGYEEELGDLLFATVNVARMMKVESELAMGAAVDKFIRRFEAMEHAIETDGKHLEQMQQVERDLYWDRVKHTV